MTTGRRLFCKEFLCFDTIPCRHMPLLVHFWIAQKDTARKETVYAWQRTNFSWLSHACISREEHDWLCVSTQLYAFGCALLKIQIKKKTSCSARRTLCIRMRLLLLLVVLCILVWLLLLWWYIPCFRDGPFENNEACLRPAVRSPRRITYTTLWYRILYCTIIYFDINYRMLWYAILYFTILYYNIRYYTIT